MRPRNDVHWIRGALTLTVAVSVLLTAACSTTKPWINQPLRSDELVLYDGRRHFADPDRAADLMVIASFSGGGSRAAALAHATLSELDQVRFNWAGRDTSLVREIDMVGGVSGGSVAAAHLALHGYADHLRRFPDDFLKVDFQSNVLGAAANPANLFRMTSPWFGRGHILAEQLDSLLFQGATFGDLLRYPGRPMLVIGATDLSNGAEFDFASEQMALLCSSIDRVPLSFAVAASSALPLVFSPLTLRNFAGECATARPKLLADSNASRTARVRLVRSELESFAHADRQFVHLVDGGVSDNLGLRRISDFVEQVGGVKPVLAAMHDDRNGPVSMPRRIVFIAINSERSASLPIDKQAEVPTMFEVLDTMVFGALSRYSRETSLVFSDAVEQWRRELRSDAADTSDFDIFLIQINLSDLRDKQVRERALAIPTAFRITEDDRSLLRQAAALALQQSSELQRFVQSTVAR